IRVYRLRLWCVVHVNRAAERPARTRGARKALSAEEEESRCLSRGDQRADNRPRVVNVGARHVRAREAVPGSQRTIGVDRAPLKFTRPGAAVVDAFPDDDLAKSRKKYALSPAFASQIRIKRSRSDRAAKGTRVINVICAQALGVRSSGISRVAVDEVEFAAKRKQRSKSGCRGQSVRSRGPCAECAVRLNRRRINSVRRQSARGQAAGDIEISVVNGC